MRTKKLLVAVAALSALAFSACSGNKKSESPQTGDTEASASLGIDDVLANADSLAGKEITLQGICTHTCKHGATKIFLMGSEDTKTIRVEACDLGSFDTKCVNSIVEVKGTLVEDRVDEAYLQNWEQRLRAQAGEKYGDEKAGCDAEKNAWGETENTAQKRIAAFRARIAQRKARTGKDYLSFYHVDAVSYDIKD